METITESDLDSRSSLISPTPTVGPTVSLPATRTARATEEMAGQIAELKEAGEL